MKIGLALLLMSVGAALPSLASSFYIGSDTACFFPLSQSSCTLTSAQSSLGVNLSGNPILFYTPNAGFSAPDTGGSVELGTFNVSQSLLGVEGGTFDVNVAFTAPGGGGNTYVASTLGLVIFGQLGAEVTFKQPTTQLYTYPGGAFEVSLPTSPILIGAGSRVTLDAVITPVPEPASIAVVGGLLLLAAVFFRRSQERRARS